MQGAPTKEIRSGGITDWEPCVYTDRHAVLARARNILRARSRDGRPSSHEDRIRTSVRGRKPQGIRNIHGNASCVCRGACFGTPLGARCVHPVHSSGSSSAPQRRAAQRYVAVPRYVHRIVAAAQRSSPGSSGDIPISFFPR